MEITEKLKLETKVDSMRHHDKTHSVTMTVENTHVDLRTSYNWTGGNYTHITIFNMTPEQMKTLGEQIIEAAAKEADLELREL